jgi:hypothetical protein
LSFRRHHIDELGAEQDPKDRGRMPVAEPDQRSTTEKPGR